jgi:hypothetical protein
MKRLALAMAALACASLPVHAADQTYGALGVTKKLKDMGDGTYAEQLYVGGGSVSGPLPAALSAGQAKIAAASTAACLPSAVLQNGIVVKALASNTGSLALGAAGVTTATDGTGTGYVLAPGEAMALAVSNANLICFNGTTVGDGVSFAGN